MLSITHEIQTAFDENPTVDVRGVFLDISKTFDRVWHDGIILRRCRWTTIAWNREQRVVLNGQALSGEK